VLREVHGEHEPLRLDHLAPDALDRIVYPVLADHGQAVGAAGAGLALAAAGERPGGGPLPPLLWIGPGAGDGRARGVEGARRDVTELVIVSCGHASSPWLAGSSSTRPGGRSFRPRSAGSRPSTRTPP